MANFHTTKEGEPAVAIPGAVSLVEALIHAADAIAARYDVIAARLPYRRYSAELPQLDVAELTGQLAAATWRRLGEEVPSYGFAEELGRRFRTAKASVGSLLLHWQILRRAVHLVLAEKQIRTGGGGEDTMRQSALMNYTMDWATEASLVGFVMAEREKSQSL